MPKMLKTITGVRPKMPKPEYRKSAPIAATEPEHLIHGEPADSKEEWYISVALEWAGFDYSYQHQVGIPGTRGSQRLDFLVYTPGRWTILDVRGRYWHSGVNEDEIEIRDVARKNRWILLVAWDNEIVDIATAKNFVTTKIGGR